MERLVQREEKNSPKLARNQERLDERVKNSSSRNSPENRPGVDPAAWTPERNRQRQKEERTKIAPLRFFILGLGSPSIRPANQPNIHPSGLVTIKCLLSRIYFSYPVLFTRFSIRFYTGFYHISADCHGLEKRENPASSRGFRTISF